jgi:shikimate kinase
MSRQRRLVPAQLNALARKSQPMPLILIIGTSTSGKSTVAIELSKRGYVAYDTEHNGISAYYNKATGKYAASFGDAPERTPEWLSQHAWNMSLDRIKEIKETTKGTLAFLCGGSDNANEVRALCDTTIWLHTNEATIRTRVNNPRDHDYGTLPHELELAFTTAVTGEAYYRKLGAIVIDATQPINKVVDDILAAVDR